MNRTAKIIISILLIYIFCLLNFNGCNNQQKIVEVEKIDTIQIFDTAYIQLPPEIITIEKPIPKYITEVRVDTIKENTILVTENKIYQDTLCNQNDSIIIQSSITGINPTLDYTQVDWRKQDKVITNTITVTKYLKPKRITVAPQLGFGYGIINKKADIYAGIGINVTI